jgi:hypothetical protein
VVHGATGRIPLAFLFRFLQDAERLMNFKPRGGIFINGGRFLGVFLEKSNVAQLILF